MAKVRRSEWPGMGFIRYVGTGKDTVRTYVIRKRIGGKQFEISTRRGTPEAALAEFRRFEEDPHSYKPLPDAPPAPAPGPLPVFLTGSLQDDYLRFSARECENSAPWYAKKRLYLSWWADELRDVNLRKLDIEAHVLGPLKRRTGRDHALAVIKHFVAWTRDPEHGPDAPLRLVGEEGRTVIDFRPRKKSRAKQETVTRWFPYQHWLAVRPHVTNWMKDAGEVLAATGWHSTELRVFVRKELGAGAIEDPPDHTALPGTDFTVEGGVTKSEDGSKVLVTRHKGGGIHKTRVSAETAVIAARLQKGGKLNLTKFTNRLAWLCRKKDLREDHDGPKAPLPDGIEPAVTPGAFRHSVATWLMNAKVPLPVISTFLGHMSPATTKKFYATLGVADNPMLGQPQRPKLAVVK